MVASIHDRRGTSLPSREQRCQLFAEYACDGQNRRVLKKTYLGGVLDNVEYFYCLGSSLIGEEKVSGTVLSDDAPADD